MVTRSVEMIVGILAVLKSGGSYIPIDPAYPQERIEYMLNNSNSKFLLTFETLKDKVSYNKKIFVELENSSLYSHTNKHLKPINKPTDSSYIIYTSGSTGLPKGVVLNHKALSNLTKYCHNYVEYLQDNKYRTIVSVTTVSFDIFIFETLISLTRGLKLVIANEDEQNIPRLLNNLIEKYDISIIQTTPARMQIFVNNYSSMPMLKNLKYITLAGEPLPITLANRLKEISGAKIYNGYGPSETTVFSTLTDVTDQKVITIGKPLSNTQIYILDKNLHLVPIGYTGELYIAGDGVGKGYLNKPELTSKSFLSNPFNPGTIMYKSGDLGRYLPNGEILCLGRSDNQVKIRGLRIELEEIEHKILDNKAITNCVVAKKVDENSHEFLCAYYTASQTVQVEELRAYLAKQLPNYMVPQYFMELEKLPYTPNGKVNRKVLPLPKLVKKQKISMPARNNTDKELLKIIQELLNIKDVSINDSFFEIGGDSLTAINLCTYIYDTYSINISVKDIFEHPIIMELSDILSHLSKSSNKKQLLRVSKQSEYIVSYAEQSIYFASIMAGNNSVNYNIPCGLLFDKVPNIKKLELSFQLLIKRHEILRTFFEFHENSLVQKVQNQLEFNLEVVKEPILENEIKKYYNEFIKPFNLSTPPLFKTRLLRIKDSENYKALLLFDIHHIICDGTSLKILIDDLCAFYNSEQLPKLTVTYKDFSFNERKLLSSNRMKEAETYWISHLESNLPVLRMPTNFPRPAIQSFNGSKVCCSLSTNYVRQIEDICKNFGITPYIFTLAAYYVLLYNYTAQDDIVIGSPYNGRTYQEVQNIVGMFVNTLPIRAKIDRNSSFEMFLKSLKDICLNAYKYQSYPFELLVRKLNIPRNASRNPIFDTIFVFQNTMNFDAKFKDLNVSYYSNDNKISKFDLSLEIIPNIKGFDINFEYCTDLFTKSFIQTLSTQYIDILKQVISNINTNICDINIHSESENLLQLSDTSLNDIEHAIYQYPNIDKAHVQLNSANKIVAYFSSTHNITVSDLKAFIQRKLPSYFIPEHFVQLDKLKLNDEGKIDEKLLNKLQNKYKYEEPSTKNQKILAQMFKDVLKLDDVSINDNFFEIGGDSLYAIQLQIEAFSKGLEFSYRDIFTYPTIKQLAEQISKSTSPVERDNYDYSKINELLSKNTGKIISKKEKIKNILLTGATGYMGSHILDNLLKHTKCNIYCLIRAKNNTDPQTRLLDILRFYFGPKYDKYLFKRLFVVEGDITAKNLKLSRDVYERLGNNVSCVINSAAIVKHYGNSNVFNNTNISGTQNIVDFCNKFNCKLIHLSTLSVSGNIFETDNYQVSDLSSQTIFSEKDLYIGQDLSNIYIHTKFIAERLILENILNNNLNAKIIRLGNITNRYSDGAFQINVSENAFLNRIHSFLQLGCFPDYLLDNYMEFTPVDYCADAVVKIALQSNNYTVFHVYNNNHITFRELKDIFDKLHYDIQIVTKEEFNTKVKLLSSNTETKNFISGIINDFGKNKQLKYYTNIQIKNDFTNKLLNSLLFRWPKINRQYINKYIIYLRSIGYIK